MQKNVRAEGAEGRLMTQVTWEEINVWLKQAVYEKIEQQVRPCCIQAHGLEAEARESLQLNAGHLALQGSRKSIELS